MSKEFQNPNENIFDICYLGFIWSWNFDIWHFVHEIIAFLEALGRGHLEVPLQRG